MKNLFLINGPTYYGKTYLIDYISYFKKNCFFVRRYTTRNLRNNEKTLDLIHNTSLQEFDNFEYVYNYSDNYYGFKKKNIDDAIQKNNNVFIIVRSDDLINQLKRDYSYLNVVSLFIYTDKERIKYRSQEYTSEEISYRLKRSEIAYRSYLKNPNLYNEVLIDSGSREDFERIIDELLKKYISDINIKEELLTYLTLDGKIKVIPVFKDEMGNSIQIETANNEEELTQEKAWEVYFINKKKQKYEEKAEELEYLLSQESIPEKELQKFFEQNPEFILDGEYCEAIP